MGALAIAESRVSSATSKLEAYETTLAKQQTQIHMANMVNVQNKNKTKAAALATAAIAIEGGILTQTDAGFDVSFAEQGGEEDRNDIRKGRFDIWADKFKGAITDRHPGLAFGGEGSVSSGSSVDRALSQPEAPAAPGISDELADGLDTTATQEQFQSLVAFVDDEGTADQTQVSVEFQAALELGDEISALLKLPPGSTIQAALLDIDDAITTAADAAPGAGTTTPAPTAAAAPTAPPATQQPDTIVQNDQRRATLTQVSKAVDDQLLELLRREDAEKLIGD